MRERRVGRNPVMAIVGIGVDMVNIARMERAAQSAHFMERVFGDEERALFALRGHRAQVLAANFAAKEAFGKAIGTGIMQEFRLSEVQALRNERGAPYLVFSGRAEDLMCRRGWNAHLSLTHEGEYACAFVVLEGADQ